MRSSFCIVHRACVGEPEQHALRALIAEPIGFRERQMEMNRVASCLVVAAVLCVASCESDSATTPRTEAPTSLADEPDATIDSTPHSALAPPDFCELLVRTVKGHEPINDPAFRSMVTEFPGLTDVQRSYFYFTLEDAAIQIARDSGYSNDRLVNLVNETCGLNLTPVTMIE